ncbi:MAG: hypothetical protein ACRD96_14500, partial [Bryobacteraceae bacterium]
REETGAEAITLLEAGIFDVDIHPILARGVTPAHLHYDVRYRFEAGPGEPPTAAWVRLDEVSRLNPEASITRMVAKTGGLGPADVYSR